MCVELTFYRKFISLFVKSCKRYGYNLKKKKIKLEESIYKQLMLVNQFITRINKYTQNSFPITIWSKRNT